MPGGSRRPGGGLPPPPPPPVLGGGGSSSQLRRESSKRYERSRSRSPEKNSRYRRNRSRGRRSRSRSPPRQSHSKHHAHHASSSSHHHLSSSLALSSSSTAAVSAVAVMTPSISLVNTQEVFPIIRSITNPEEVKIPRRVDEGVRPIFDREELRDSIARRMQAGDNEVNPTTIVPETPQRVIAIIREPIDSIEFAKLQHQLPAALQKSSSTSHEAVHTVRPAPPRERSPSPRNSQRRKSPSKQARRSRSQSLTRARSRDSGHERNHRSQRSLAEIEAERLRERDERRRLQQQKAAASYSGSHKSPSLVDPHRRGGSTERPDRRAPARRSTSRSRTPPPIPRHILVEREREERERERERDLRCSLSRPPQVLPPSNSKFYEEDKVRSSRGRVFRGRGGRGRGGASSFRSRAHVSPSAIEDSSRSRRSASPASGKYRHFQHGSRTPHGTWKHDMYDEHHRSTSPKPRNPTEPGSSKSLKSREKNQSH